MVSKCSVRNPGLTRFRYRKLRSIKPAPHNKSSARPLRRPQGRFVAAGLAHPARRLAGVPKRALGLRPRCFERGDGADENGGQHGHHSHESENRDIQAFAPMPRDRKSTRLNSSHGYISYAVFCLKKKKKKKRNSRRRTQRSKPLSPSTHNTI